MRGGGLRYALRRWWWLTATCTLAAVGMAVLSVHDNVDEYVSQGSYVLRAEATSSSDLVRAAETLAGSDELISTYANIATSGLIERGARAALSDEGYDASQAQATSEIIAEANVVLIGARSHDPDTARAMAIAVGALTEDYVRNLGDAFRLEILDSPTLPQEPRGRGQGSIVAGSAFGGLLAGIALALIADRSFPSRRRRPIRHIIDPDSTAFTRTYLEMRLSEEMARARATNHTFSIGVLRVLRGVAFDPDALEPADLQEADLVAITDAIKSTLVAKDILAHVGRSRFVAILPLVDIDEARGLVERWRQLATVALLRRRHGSELVVLGGACEYDALVCVGDDDAELVAGELQARSPLGAGC